MCALLSLTAGSAPEKLVVMAESPPEATRRERLLGMGGVPLPDREEDFAADPAELFFDLTFVFAFSRLVYLLVHDPTWGGVGRFGLLFVMIWFPWSQFTWSANAVPGNSRPVRLLFMLATVASGLAMVSWLGQVTPGVGAFALMIAVLLGVMAMSAGPAAPSRSSMAR